MNSQKKQNNLIVLIPTLNEEKSIGNLVEKCLKYTNEVLIIDGLSSDLTIEKAKESGAKVITCDEKGKGSALVKGFKYVLDNYNFSHVAYLDGDNTYDPDDLPKLFEVTSQRKKSDLVIGNRFPLREKGTITKINMIGNRIFSLLISIITRQKIIDTQSGFRLLNKEVTEFVSKNLTSANFEIETEMIIRTSKRGFKIREIKINYFKREGTSKLNPFFDGFRILKTIFQSLFFKENK